VLAEKLHDIGSRLEHTPRKSPKRLAQETGVSKSSARTATHLLKECYICVFNELIAKKYLREDGIFNNTCYPWTVTTSECYRPSGMLIRQQNSHAPRGRRCTGRRELVKWAKIHPVLISKRNEWLRYKRVLLYLIPKLDKLPKSSRGQLNFYQPGKKKKVLQILRHLSVFRSNGIFISGSHIGLTANELGWKYPWWRWIKIFRTWATDVRIILEVM
jgi:hypothetical protein